MHRNKRDRMPRSDASSTGCHRVWRHSMLTICLVLSLTGSLLMGGHPPARGDPFRDKSDQFLRQRMASRPIPRFTAIILKLSGKLTPARERQLRSLGGDIYRHLPLIHSVALRVPTPRLRNLSALPFVTRLSEDRRVRQDDAFTLASSGADIAFQTYGLTGAGVTVAVVDSGIYLHPDLGDPTMGRSRVLASVNFAPLALNAGDQYGHGTHVAGILAGNGAASTGSAYYRTFYGIARGANLLNVRVLDAAGGGDVSTAVAGIQWVVSHKAAYNIRILNLSLGHSVGESYATDPLCQAVEQAWKAGIVVVCAAGNQGRKNPVALGGSDNEGYGTTYGSIDAPGSDPYVITVGATKSLDGIRSDDRIATYSSRGPTRLDLILKPDIVAPGNQVISLRCPGSVLDLTQGLIHDVPPGAYMVHPPLVASSAYFSMSGTSMATPVVAGAAALMLQADATLSPDAVKARLMIAADKWRFADGTTDACTFGAGYLNIPAALNCRAMPTQYALSPPLSRDSQGNITIDLGALVWGMQAPWNLGALWGVQPLWSDAARSGMQALWSDFTLWSSSTVVALPVLQDER